MTGRRLLLLGCPLLALGLYLPALRSDFVFDDRGVILMNPLMTDLRELPRLLVTPYWNAPGHARELYRPLTSASFAVDAAISGMRPASAAGTGRPSPSFRGSAHRPARE